MNPHEAPHAPPRPMDLGRIFSTGFGAWGRNLLPFTAMGLFIFSPAIILAAVFAVDVQDWTKDLQRGSFENLGKLYGFLTGITFLRLFLTFPLTAAVVFGVFEQMLGRRPDLGRCLSMGFSRLFPVLGVSFVVGIIVTFAMLALCVPGFILYCMWYVVIPVAVVERAGVGGSLSRSSFLTKGSRWYIFALILVLGVLGGAVGGITQLAIGAAMPETPNGLIALAVIQEFVNLLASILGAVMMTVTYHELRRVKEGIGVSELAAVFD